MAGWRSRWLVRAIVGTAAVSLLSVGAIGFLHTKMGKPLLMKVGGCPAANAKPADVEKARDRSVAASRGDQAAPSRPALGFTLDKSTLAEVRAWADQNHVSCKEKREGTLLQCEAVPARLLPQPTAQDGTYADVSFGFRTTDKTLMAVTALRTGLSPREAATRTRAVASALEKELATAPHVAGEPTAEYLSETSYATVAVDYRYSDYLVDVTATSLPDRGVAVYERYTSGKTGG